MWHSWVTWSRLMLHGALPRWAAQADGTSSPSSYLELQRFPWKPPRKLLIAADIVSEERVTQTLVSSLCKAFCERAKAHLQKHLPTELQRRGRGAPGGFRLCPCTGCRILDISYQVSCQCPGLGTPKTLWSYLWRQLLQQCQLF